MANKTTVINLWGGPCSGKSTAATGLFHLLKQSDTSIEYVSEYAKDIVFEGTRSLLENQLHIFSEQFRRQFRLLGKVDYIITDSPILLSSIYFDRYNDQTLMYTPEYADLTKRYFLETYRQFENSNFFITRDSDKYSTLGRNESPEEAEEIDQSILGYLNTNNIPYETTSQNTAICQILEKHFQNKH